jgi:hypothetical protein
LLASFFSLLAVFHAAFLGSETDFRQRLWKALGMLIVAAAISLASGLAFSQAAQPDLGDLRVLETFPMRIFFWGTGLIATLFLLAWYLETHCIFYKDIHS